VTTLPTSVVLIGHSLGGLVAKSLLLSSSSIKPASIQLILTLATPHSPVLLMDVHAHNFYEKVW
jgi:triacylglycerol esterase/lipase EstA (alpha/beta hydrolase family)